MKRRCLSKRASQYKWYGGRGITVCQQWIDSFDQFLKDMGPKPTPQHTIERRNNDGNYEPGNCYWLEKTKQTTNSRNTKFIEHNGVTDSCAGWARRTGIPVKFLLQRLSRGWPVLRALTEPPANRGRNAW